MEGGGGGQWKEWRMGLGLREGGAKWLLFGATSVEPDLGGIAPNTQVT